MFQVPSAILQRAKVKEECQKQLSSLMQDYVASPNYFLLNSFEQIYIRSAPDGQPDLQSAIETIKKLSEWHHPPSMTIYSYLLSNGVQVEKNQELASQYAVKAADYGYASAQNLYGLMCSYEEKLQNY